MSLFTIFKNLHHFAAIVLLAVGALLPIVGPLSGAPIFLSMTADLAQEDRSRMAKAVAVNSFLLLIASALIGAYVLDIFGLSIPTVQVAGGLVVCAIAWSLLNSPSSLPTLVGNGPSTITPAEFSQRAFYPLTMPLTVGPGSIAVALTLGANPARGLRPLVVTALAHALGILIVAVSVYLCYRYADRILKKLGPTVTSVAVRLSAFILLCIGVNICWNGLRALLVGAFPNVVL
ncbi:MAG TPA: MarC family protein [Nitrospirota bacterium]|nr:MarC family protein [Nitrospirota bacterium]